MDEFNFKNKYNNLDDDEIDSTEEISEDELDLDFDEEIVKEEDIFPTETKEKKHHTLGFIVAICIILPIACILLFGYRLMSQNQKLPQIESVHIESDNPENSSEAKYGSMITLTFSFKEDLANTPAVVINDKKVIVYGKGKNYYAKYFVQLQEKEEKKVTFSIYDYKNKLRKTGQPVTETTDGSSVVILAFK